VFVWILKRIRNIQVVRKNIFLRKYQKILIVPIRTNSLKINFFVELFANSSIFKVFLEVLKNALYAQNLRI